MNPDPEPMIPDPGPITPEPDPGPMIPDPDPEPMIPDPGPITPDPDPGPMIPDPGPIPVLGRNGEPILGVAFGHGLEAVAKGLLLLLIELLPLPIELLLVL